MSCSSSASSIPSSVETPPYSPLSGSSDDAVSLPPSSSNFPSFKMIGDNLDTYVKPREMRLDHQAKSLNFFNTYGVKGRVDVSQLEDNPCLPDFDSFKEGDLLPSASDDAAIASNFTVLVARVLKKHMPFFKKFATGVTKHIKHEHYAETSQKSEVVSHYVNKSV